MKDFRHFNEMTSQAATKSFEDDILAAALAGGKVEPTVKRADQVAKAARSIINTIGTPTEGFKPGKAAGYPGTRTSQPKADISVKANGKWYNISVKLDGGFVLNSAENAEEFRQFYFASFDLFLKHFGDANTQTASKVNEFKKEIDHIADNIIGSNSGLMKKDYYASRTGKVKRPIWDEVALKYDEAIKKAKDQGVASTLKDTKKLIIERLQEDNEQYKGQFMAAKRNLEKQAKDIVFGELWSNSDLKRCIVFEAMTGYQKFGSPDYFFSLKKHGPAANFAVSASGFKDMRDIKSSFFDHIESNIKYELRTMPIPGKVGKYIDQITGKKVSKKGWSFEDAISALQTIKLSSKLISTIKEDLDVIIEEAENIEQQNVISESIFSKFVDIVKRFFDKIKKTIIEAYNTFTVQLKEISSLILAPTTITEALVFFNLAPEGKIQIKY